MCAMHRCVMHARPHCSHIGYCSSSGGGFGDGSTSSSTSSIVPLPVVVVVVVVAPQPRFVCLYPLARSRRGCFLRCFCFVFFSQDCCLSSFCPFMFCHQFLPLPLPLGLIFLPHLQWCRFCPCPHFLHVLPSMFALALALSVAISCHGNIEGKGKGKD